MNEHDKSRKLKNSIEEAMRERSAVEAPTPGAEAPEAGRVTTEDAWEAIAREWHEVIPKVRETFSELSEEELTETSGNYERFLQALSARYRLTRQEAEARVKSWLEQLGSKGA